MARKKGLSQQAGPVTPASGQFAGQTFASYRQLQNARAIAAGYPSHAVKLATTRKPASSLLDNPARFKQSTAGRANEAVLALRRDPGLTLAQAARLAHTTPGAMKRYAGTSLERVGNRLIPKKNDRAIAVMSVLTPQGPIVGLVQGSRARDLIVRHSAWLNAVINSASPMSVRELKKFARRSVVVNGRRVQFVSTLAEVQHLVRLGLYTGAGPYDTGDMDVAA